MGGTHVATTQQLEAMTSLVADPDYFCEAAVNRHRTAKVVLNALYALLLALIGTLVGSLIVIVVSLTAGGSIDDLAKAAAAIAAIASGGGAAILTTQLGAAQKTEKSALAQLEKLKTSGICQI
jgi:hypothetical protein